MRIDEIPSLIPVPSKETARNVAYLKFSFSIQCPPSETGYKSPDVGALWVQELSTVISHG